MIRRAAFGDARKVGIDGDGAGGSGGRYGERWGLTVTKSAQVADRGD
jgi:hypothetical protein